METMQWRRWDEENAKDAPLYHPTIQTAHMAGLRYYCEVWLFNDKWRGFVYYYSRECLGKSDSFETIDEAKQWCIDVASAHSAKREARNAKQRERRLKNV